MKLATREIIREIDRASIEEYGIDGLMLMENAGRAVASVVLQDFPSANRIAIFAGAGNNGGDGFVTARHLLSAGMDVTTYLLSESRKYRGDALANLQALRKIGARLVELKGSFSHYQPADLIIDAIFGTGLTREAEGFHREAIDFINSRSTSIVAVDLPSGLDADTGFPLGVSVIADVTVTFALPKVGMAIYPGLDYAGKVYVVDITTPKFLEDDIPYELITFDTVRKILNPRQADTHKGTFGHLLVLSGSPGKTGAATLVARGALRVGTGLVTVGVPESLNPILEEKLTEAMTEPIPGAKGNTFGTESVDRALEIMSSRKTALAVGPGISTTGGTGKFLHEILKRSTLPVVVDADGISILANNPDILKRVEVPIILTPHPGEMSRLIGKSSKDVQNDRIGVARDFSAMYNVFTVLKGARTVVSTPGGEVFINPTGNPGMASGGTGDVLTGVISGLLAQGHGPRDASILGVFAHGLAGDLVAEAIGNAGIIAGDVAEYLPLALKKILDGEGEDFFYKIR